MAEAAFANDAVLEGPALLPANLEVEIRVIDTALHYAAKRTVQMTLAQPCRLQQR